jgi:hypothetical protein
MNSPNAYQVIDYSCNDGLEWPLLRAAEVRQDLSWQGMNGQIGRPVANPGIARAGALSGLIFDFVAELASPG